MLLSTVTGCHASYSAACQGRRAAAFQDVPHAQEAQRKQKRGRAKAKSAKKPTAKGSRKKSAKAEDDEEEDEEVSSGKCWAPSAADL